MVMNIPHMPKPNSQSPSAAGTFCLDSVIGVTIFDLNGLPKEYYGTPENDDTSWIQVVFQALGLEMLFESAFQFGKLQYSIIHDTPNPAVVFKMRTYCVAFLLSPINFRDVAERLATQIDQFHPGMPAADPRFSTVVRP
jgi:hypothetical protein